MEKIIKNLSLEKKYIDKIINDTNRVTKQLNFLSKVENSNIQKGGTIGDILEEKTYEKILEKANELIKNYYQNKDKFNQQQQEEVQNTIDNFNQYHPPEEYPNDINFTHIEELSNLVNSLRDNVEKVLPASQINKENTTKDDKKIKASESSSKDPKLKKTDVQKSEQKISRSQEAELDQEESKLDQEESKLDQEKPKSQQVESDKNDTEIPSIEPPSTKQSSTKTNGKDIPKESTISRDNILRNISDIEKIKIYNQLIEAGLEYEMKRNEELKKKLETNLTKLKSASAKYNKMIYNSKYLYSKIKYNGKKY